MADVTGVMQASWRRPCEPLRPFIAGYTGYLQVGAAPGLHRGLPSPYLTLIVALGDPISVVAHVDPREPAADYWTLIGGLHTSPALIAHPGRQAGIQVAVRPLGARALFGLPAGELAGRDIGADVLLGPTAHELSERVAQAQTWDERFAGVEAVLLRRLCPDALVRPEVDWAWRRLLDSGGRTSIAKLAADVGWSTRYLDRVMRVETGLSPKVAARVVRFDNARRRLAVGGISVAAVAAETGYHDQAHLARDFRSFAGCAPSVWLAEERVNSVEAAPALP
jgi:AraC-like DNA-binding protein